MSSIKNKLIAKEQIIGTMINVFDHVDIVKILKNCGFDFFIVDCEHGCMDYSRLAALIAVAKEMDFGAFVRVPSPTREYITHYIEMGADGLMLPNTDTAQQAKKLVEYAKYSPLGNRGVSLFRGHTRYAPVPDALEYMKQANEQTILIAQVESSTSVNNIEEILAVEGIDIAFIGPNDLCHNLGVTGQQDHPLYIEAVDKVINAAQKLGKTCGTHGMNANALKKWIDKGVSFNIYSNEVSMIMNDAKAALAILKN